MDSTTGSGRSEFWQLAWAKLPPATVQGLQALSKGPNTPASSNQDVEDILELAKKQKAACESKKWEVKLGSQSFRVRNGLSNIIDWLQRFKEVGDVVVNFDPVHAALPWAPFRLLLQTHQAATANRDTVESIIALLELVSRLIQHGRVFEKVHSLASQNTHGEQDVLDELKQTVVDLYVAVLESLMYCCTRLGQSTARRSSSAFLKPQETEDVIRQLTKRWNAVEDNARSLRGLHMVKIFVEIQGHLPEVLRTLRDLKDVSKILVQMEGNERFRILDNISKIQVGSQHKSVHDRRTKDTGEWLLSTPKFRQWETDESCPVTLLYGSLVAGAGKTFLISRVIDHIRKRLEGSEPNCGLAYFYCDRNDIGRRQPIAILSSFVRQLASPFGRTNEVHQYIQALDKKLRSECLKMDLQLCQDALIELVASYKCSTIVLDALDECDEQTRSQLMRCLNETLSRCRNLKVFISSRTEYDIKRFFNSQPTITIRATDNQNDIESFVRQKLSSDVHWNNLDAELQKEAQATLFAKSKGMFQWANLQVQELLRIKHLSDKAIRECLQALPATLDETYGQIWEKINKQNPTDRKIGRRAIKWALSVDWASRASREIFREALRVDDETDSLYDIDETPSIPVIEGACYNLLVYDRERSEWRFCHLSAAEYMESTAMSNLQPHRDAAITCFKHLLDGVRSESTYSSGLGVYSFSSYALRNWQYHMKHYHDSSAMKHPQLEHLFERFLGSATQSAKPYQIWENEIEYCYSGDLQPSSSPLFGIVGLGFGKVLKNWYDHDPNIDLNLQNANGISLIGLAARECHLDLCQFLVAKGVDLEAGKRSPLQLVCSNIVRTLSLAPYSSPWVELKEEHGTVKEIAALLISNGADINARDKEGLTPLDVALRGSNKDLISILVKHDAKILDLGAALENTLRLGQPDWIRYCLDSGAGINEYEERLAWTLTPEHTKQVRMLLDAGMDVNCVSKMGNTLLNIAASHGSLSLISMLIKAGANPNLKEVKKGPIYQAAASRVPGGSNSIKELFHKGAAINPPEGVSPLIGACSGKDALHRSKLLLDLGADPNQVRRGESLLVAAATSRNKSLFRLFLDAGADLNSKEGSKNALLIASCSHHRNYIRRWLLDAGADPTLTFPKGAGSALAFAALIGNIKACSFFLDQELGVNVNAKLHGWFDNVLLAAMAPAFKTEETTSEIISLLFEAGANILIPRYKTLAPSLPAINFKSRRYFVSNTRATFGFSRHWLSIVWVMSSSLPRPYVPLSTALRRYNLPSSIPLSAKILIELTSITSPPSIKYACILISPNESTRFIFNKRKLKFERIGGARIATHIATSEGNMKGKGGGRFNGTSFYLVTSSIEPAPSWSTPPAFCTGLMFILFVFIAAFEKNINVGYWLGGH
ncbi:unnamed protein product [Clonostachys rosea]|uniref:Nephrocystin 3-like N-terminal domain-containing protein n=1 Tax=Bionectria ochroleuca TaxID=29856 RepID=A0ABY6U8G4_BIOOC|nr:unnamed protein product [Clonostachys rosea]